MRAFPASFMSLIGYVEASDLALQITLYHVGSSFDVRLPPPLAFGFWRKAATGSTGGFWNV